MLDHVNSTIFFLFLFVYWVLNLRINTNYNRGFDLENFLIRVWINCDWAFPESGVDHYVYVSCSIFVFFIKKRRERGDPISRTKCILGFLRIASIWIVLHVHFEIMGLLCLGLYALQRLISVVVESVYHLSSFPIFFFYWHRVSKNKVLTNHTVEALGKEFSTSALWVI